MEIQFDTTVDDIAEHRFRIFAQGPSYKKNRWFGVIGSFLGVGIVFLLLHKFSATSLPLWFPLLLGGTGAAVGYLFFYPDIIRKKIKNFLTAKVTNELPCQSSYTIENQRITCKSFKMDNVSFDLSQLTDVAQDQRFIQLSFGREPKDFWIIPKRAFDSEDEIDRFLNKLKGQRTP